MENKFIYFNDTNKIVSIHPATISHGCEVDMSGIEPGTIRIFKLPEGAYAWLKMWDYNTHFQILVTPHSIWDDNPMTHEPSDIDPSLRKSLIQQSVSELFKKRDPHKKEDK